MSATKLLAALDTLAVALADEGHIWTTEERRCYEQSVAELLPAVTEREHILSEHCWCEPVVDSYGPGGHVAGVGA